MQDLKYWIWLSRIPGLGPKNLFKLIDKYKKPELIWSLTKKELLENKIGLKLCEEILDSKYKENLDKFIEYMLKNNIGIITIYDNDYPINLRQIYDFPVILYYKGNKKILKNQSVGIVGCREPSLYGENVSKKLAYNLSGHNINVVSGLAKRNRLICTYRGAKS